jgi:hypothetical protein
MKHQGEGGVVTDAVDEVAERHGRVRSLALSDVILGVKLELGPERWGAVRQYFAEQYLSAEPRSSYQSDAWSRIYDLVKEHNVEFHGEYEGYGQPPSEHTVSGGFRAAIYGAASALVDAHYPELRRLYRERDELRAELRELKAPHSSAASVSQNNETPKADTP